MGCFSLGSFHGAILPNFVLAFEPLNLIGLNLSYCIIFGFWMALLMSLGGSNRNPDLKWIILGSFAVAMDKLGQILRVLLIISPKNDLARHQNSEYLGQFLYFYENLVKCLALMERCEYFAASFWLIWMGFQQPYQIFYHISLFYCLLSNLVYRWVFMHPDFALPSLVNVDHRVVYSKRAKSIKKPLEPNNWLF